MYAFIILHASPEQSYNQWLNCCAVSWSLQIKKPSGKPELLKDLILPDKEKIFSTLISAVLSLSQKWSPTWNTTTGKLDQEV